MRSYTDGGEHYDGQIGSEATPAGYVAALLDCTREWMRVLKPEGSLFVNLGDSYYSGKGAPGRTTMDPKNAGRNARRTTRSPLDYGLDLPRKTLVGLPWRYALGCIDDLGLILRSEIVWAKVNGLPESVTDRVRRSHEQVFHFTKQPRYFAAVDEIRESHQPQSIARTRRNRFAPDLSQAGVGSPNTLNPSDACNPLGKLPGSVWDIPSTPLIIPDAVAHARCCGGRKRDGCKDGLVHYAAFPPALVRPIILGWSPPGICVECGEGRRPVVEKPRLLGGDNNPESRHGTRCRSTMDGGSREWARRVTSPDRIIAYSCTCTPFTDHPGSGAPTRRRDYSPGLRDNNAQGSYGRHQAGEYERIGPWREYHLDRWTPPPSRPAVVLDPFGGTGTTALVASVLGRTSITVDRSMDYSRLAKWRTADPGERARALGVPKPPPVPDGQDSLFDLKSA